MCPPAEGPESSREDHPPVVDGRPERSSELALFERMLFIRRIEERIAELFGTGEITGTSMHASMGQEANSVAVGSLRRPGDVMFSSHRGLAHCLGWGADPVRTVAEALGRRGGYAAGLAGHMHIVDVEQGILGTNGIVGSGLPLAVGAALGLSELRQGALAVVFFGDGAIGTGAWHEAVNLAAVWGLPVLFFCENNGFAEMTYSKTTTAGEPIEHAIAYGIDAERIDGSDVEAALDVVTALTERIRTGRGPAFIESRTLRIDGHWVGDPQHYRVEEDTATELPDPIDRIREACGSVGVDTADAERLIETRVEALFDQVLTMEEAQPEDFERWKELAR